MALDPWGAAILRFGIPGLLAPVLSLLLRVARLPGHAPSSALVAGLVAGLLSGPVVLDAVAPGLAASLRGGDGEPAAQIAELRAEHEAELAALRHTGVSAVAIEERAREQAEALEPLLRVQRQREQAFRDAGAMPASVLAGLVLLAGALVGRRRMPRPGDLREAPPMLLAGILIVAVTVLGTAVMVVWLLGFDQRRALTIGAALAGGSAFSHLPMRPLGVEGRRVSTTAGNVIAFLLCMVILILAIEHDRRMWLLAPVMGVFLASMLRGRIRSTRARRRMARGFILTIGVPLLVAWMVSQSDPRLIVHSGGAVWFAILAVAFAGTGHFLGAWLGLQAFGTHRQRARAIEIWLDSHAQGVSLTQVVLLSVLVCAGVIEPDTPEGASLVLSLCTAIALMEMSIGWLRRLVADGGAPTRP